MTPEPDRARLGVAGLNGTNVGSTLYPYGYARPILVMGFDSDGVRRTRPTVAEKTSTVIETETSEVVRTWLQGLSSSVGSREA
jgi:hypothetical protein